MSMKGIKEAVLSRRSLPLTQANVRRHVWFSWQLLAELDLDSRVSVGCGVAYLRSPCILKSQHHDDIDRALECSRSCGVCPQSQALAVETIQEGCRICRSPIVLGALPQLQLDLPAQLSIEVHA
jgi:hypothetical protein